MCGTNQKNVFTQSFRAITVLGAEFKSWRLQDKYLT